MTDEELLASVDKWHDWIEENPGQNFALGSGYSIRLVQMIKEMKNAN